MNDNIFERKVYTLDEVMSLNRYDHSFKRKLVIMFRNSSTPMAKGELPKILNDKYNLRIGFSDDSFPNERLGNIEMEYDGSRILNFISCYTHLSSNQTNFMVESETTMDKLIDFIIDKKLSESTDTIFIEYVDTFGYDWLDRLYDIGFDIHLFKAEV